MKRKFFAAILFLLIGWAVFLNQPLCYALDWKQLHEQADKTSLSDALEEVNKSPRSEDKLYLLGLVYLNAHKDREAGEIFQRIIILNAQSIEAMWGRAEVLRRGHKTEESEALLNKIIKTRPDFYPAYISLAYINPNFSLEKFAPMADRKISTRFFVFVGVIPNFACTFFLQPIRRY